MKTKNPSPPPSSQKTPARFRWLGSTAKLATALALGVAMLAPSARSQTNLVGHWLTGAADFNDAAGYAPTNTFDGFLVPSVTGSVLFTNDVPANHSGQSLFFTAGDSGLIISNTSTLNLEGGYTNVFDAGINNAFTVSVWARGFPTGAWSPWVSKYGENGAGWQIRNDGSVAAGTTWACWTIRNGSAGNTTNGLSVFGNSDDLATRSFASNNGLWHNYVGVFNSVTGERTMYIDGSLAAGQNSNSAPVSLAGPEYLAIGARDAAPGNTLANFSTVQIYDVRIYNFGLSAAQVQDVVGPLAPTINTQPVGQNAFTGATIKLTASGITGTAPITYQWKLNNTNVVEGTNFIGVQTTSLTVSNVALNDVGTYQLYVTNAVGFTVSSNAIVNIQVIPVAPTNQFAVQTIADAPAAYWRLSETNDVSGGGVLAYDFATGHAHNATYGASTVNRFNGILAPQPPTYLGFATDEGALQVAGTAGAVSTVTVPPLNLPTNTVDTTIAMWINPARLVGTFTGLFFNSADAAGINMSGNVVGGQNTLGYTWNNAATTYNFNSGLLVPLNTWSFVVVVVQANQATLYMDYVDPNTLLPVISAPVVNATAHTAEAFATGTTSIGQDPRTTDGTRTFAGAIADVAVYHAALTSAQVSQLFAKGLGVSAPQISGQPASVYAFLGDSASFTANGILGATPLAYQWQHNGINVTNDANVSGANTNKLSIVAVSSNDIGTYVLTLTNSFGFTVSSNATLSVQGPSLVGEWLSGNADLVEVSGYRPAGTVDGYAVGALTYGFTNDVPPGQAGQSLLLSTGDTAIEITNSATSDGGYDNTFDNALAKRFTVTAWAKGLPGAWNPWVSKYGEGSAGWQLRQFNATGMAAFTVRDGNAGGVATVTNATGTTRGGGGDDMNATAFPTTNGNWHFYAGTFDSVTGVRSLYIDGQLAAQETNNVAYGLAPAEHLAIGARENPQTGGGFAFQNFFIGQIFDVRLYNYALTQPQVVAILGNKAPEINGQPPSITAFVGHTAQIGVTGVAGTPALTYQWQFAGTNLANGNGYSGVNTPTLSFTNVTTSDAGAYVLAVTNAFGFTISSNAVVTTTFPFLLGHWFNGPADMADHSGYAPAGTHDGYMIGSTNVTFTNNVPPGKTGVSLWLPVNNNSGIAISNTSTLDAGYTNTFDDQIKGAVTVMTWANRWPGGWNPWVSKNGESAGWQLRSDGSNDGIPNGNVYPCWTVRHGNVGTVTLGRNVYNNTEDMASRNTLIGSAQNGTWHHYAGVFDSVNGTRQLYVDGELAAASTGDIADNLATAAHLCIGARDTTAGNVFTGTYFRGQIYDVRIYNYPLSQAEVVTIGGVRPAPPTRTYLPPGSIGAGPNGSFVLTWDSTFFSLQTATNIAGPWTTVVGASPLTFDLSGPNQYFRTSNP